MITEICQEVRNFFDPPGGRHFGVFTISTGSIAPLDFLQEGQYFRIIGSVANDGVHQYFASDLIDEVFDGAVWEMRPPPAFISLCAEIAEYVMNGSGKISGYTSESYPNGYSYTLATDKNGAPIGWQTAFAARLNQWRKL